MRYILKYIPVIFFGLLMLSGCAGIDKGRADIYYSKKTVKSTILVDGKPVTEVKDAPVSTTVSVNIPKGERRLTVVEGDNILLDTTFVIGNGYGSSNWLAWSLGTTLLFSSVAIGSGWTLGLLLLLVPPIVTSHSDANFNVNVTEVGRTVEEPVIERFYSGMYAQISSDKDFEKEYMNLMYVSKLEAVCYDEISNLIWVEKKKGEPLFSYILEDVSACTGPRDEVECSVKGQEYWKQFPCRPAD